jgi:Na+-driven multidrug efflux pump
MVCTGVTVVINQNLGAERRETASRTATASMHLLFVMSIVLGGLMALVADPVMRLMHLEARLAPDAALFLRITAGFSVFQAIMTCAMAVSRAYGNTFYPVLVSLIMNVLNAAGSYIVHADTPLGRLTRKLTVE